MPEALSVTSLSGLSALHALAREGSAVSTAAQTVRQAASDVVEHVERSQALFGSKADAISRIWSLANECAEADWNGEGAASINRTAVFNAIAFIRLLPDSLPLPEFAPEPDGSISLDWMRSRSRIFSLSVGATDRLAYAWLDGTDKGHGVARFDGEVVPPRILDGIISIVNDANVALGST